MEISAFESRIGEGLSEVERHLHHTQRIVRLFKGDMAAKTLLTTTKPWTGPTKDPLPKFNPTIQVEAAILLALMGECVRLHLY